MIIITFIMTLAVIGVTLVSCVSDVRSMRIPNLHSLIVIGCFVPAWIAAPSAFAPLWQHLGAMVAMFGLSYAMFSMNLMGGGDSKLATALGLWLGLRGLIVCLFFMTIMGGILSLATLLIRKYKPFKSPTVESWVGQVQNGVNAVPYGIAISFGTWVAFLHTGFLDHQLNEVFKIVH